MRNPDIFPTYWAWICDICDEEFEGHFPEMVEELATLHMKGCEY